MQTNILPLRLISALWFITGFLLVAWPVALVALLALALNDPAFAPSLLPPGLVPSEVGPATLALAWAAGLPAALAGLWLLVEMRALFARYRRGEVFSPACARHIRTIGAAMLAVCLASVLGHTAAIAVLSLGNPPGERMLSVAVSSWQVAALLGAGFVTVIGHVMVEATHLAAENEGFV